MESVGIRELKQNASEVVARAERGETILVTVQGRPVATIGPVTPRKPQRWVNGALLNELLADIPADTTGWADEHYRSRDNDPIIDPWNDPRNGVT